MRERAGEREAKERRVGIKFLKFPPTYGGKSHSASPRDIQNHPACVAASFTPPSPSPWGGQY